MFLLINKKCMFTIFFLQNYKIPTENGSNWAKDFSINCQFLEKRCILWRFW